MLDPKAVQRRFDRAAATFDDADFVHAATRDGLFERLRAMKIEPAVVVDAGCATGSALRPLLRRFRGAHVVGVDLSHRMCVRARAGRPWFSRVSVIQADAARLPFASGSVDVVCANLLLPWISRPETLFAELARVLARDGVFAFSTLGPDSLIEIRRAWAAVDDGAHVNPFADMHDIGDAIVRAGLRDPVLDVDRLRVTYEDPTKLFDDLTRSGARNALTARGTGLTGRGRFDRMRAGLGRPMSLDLELIYGHCFGGGASAAGDGVRIDASSIPLRRR